MVVVELVVEDAHIGIENADIKERHQPCRRMHVETVLLDDLTRQAVVGALGKFLPPERQMGLVRGAIRAVIGTDGFDLVIGVGVGSTRDRRRRCGAKMVR